MLLFPEFLRRMQEMAEMSGQKIPETEAFEVLINTNHPLIIQLTECSAGAAQQQLLTQLYDLARLAHQQLKGASLDQFIQRGLELLQAEQKK